MSHSEDPPRPAAAPTAPDVDPLEALARTIFIELACRIYTAPGAKTDPRQVAKLAFDLAQSFMRSNLEFNPRALAAAEAKAKASVDLSKIELNLGP